MGSRRFGIVAILLLLVGARSAQGQRRALDSLTTTDTTVVHTVRLKDGSTLVGRVRSVTVDSVRIELRSGSMTFARSAVAEVLETRGGRRANGEVWFENPHATRLLFAPTAFPLPKGEGYFSDIYLFFASAQVGVTNRISIGVGASLFPTGNFGDNLFYLTPKVTLVQRDRAAFAVGGFLGYLGAAAHEGESGSLGILYGVGTVGTRSTNVTAGLGWGYYGGSIADQPVVTLGGQARVSRRLSLISENWIVSSHGEVNSLFSYGLRFLGERMSVDLAFLNGNDGPPFPGIPFVGFAVKF